MGRYIDITDVVGKYPNVARVNTGEINSYHIYYSEYKLDGLLGSSFTVPFSDNNITAKDLSIDLSYSSMNIIKGKDGDAFRKDVLGRIDMIANGSIPMITDGGDQLYSSGGLVHSSTKDYHPVFGMGNDLDFVVDSDQLTAEEDARG